jgi:hypothetical protein
MGGGVVDNFLGNVFKHVECYEQPIKGSLKIGCQDFRIYFILESPVLWAGFFY